MRYWVFGRTCYAQPLEHRGVLEATDEDLARQLAEARFGDGWVELVLVPEPDAHWVVGSPGAPGGAEEVEIAGPVDGAGTHL
ncbi:MAG: hypothetical protein C4303_02525 [candidate division GAL15 bacterium]